MQDLARTNPGDARAMDQEYRTFLAELGGGPLPPEPASGGPRGKPAPSPLLHSLKNCVCKSIDTFR